MIATKYTLTVDRDDPNAGGNHRKSLVRSLEQSLRRLRTDYVDLLWLHMRDATTPIEEAVRALDDQVRLGKVLASGSPTRRPGSSPRRTRSPSCAAGRRSSRLQSPVQRRVARARAGAAADGAALGLAVTPWGVLEAGILTGKPAAERRWPEETASEAEARVVTCSQAIAEERGATPHRSRSRGCCGDPPG